MKLPIKKKYFDLIVAGEKLVEFRDAHITFVCEETKQQCCREITAASVISRDEPEIKDKYPEELRDKFVLRLQLNPTLFIKPEELDVADE